MSTLKQMTKAELIRHIGEKDLEIQRMRYELSVAARNRPMPRAVTASQLGFQQRCNEAREAAMRTGKAVVVQSSATNSIAQHA